MRVAVEGATLRVETPAAAETLTCSSTAEAAARAAFVNEAMTWIGTPFRDCADVKGPAGAVDCAMMLTRCAVDTGLIASFDPRPYPPRWHLHRDEERFVNFITDQLGASETRQPRIGDVAVFRFGRTYSHGAVLAGCGEVVHAYGAAGFVLLSRLDEPLLAQIGLGGAAIARPVRWFDLWSART